MDITKFGDRKTGKLLPIRLHSQEKDTAFVPDPLPPQWEFDPLLWPLLAEAKQALGLLDGTARNLPNPNLLLSPLRTREALTSSRLEGTYATAQELLLFDLDPKEPKSPTDQTNAWREVSNYNRALALGFAGLDALPICIRLIKNLHATLLEGVRGAQATPGEFRAHQVHIGSDRRYVPPPPTEMEKCLHDLEEYLNAPDARFDCLVRCLMVHYQFEAIHPFGDGNGRVGRVLLALMIQNLGNLKMPWLYLSPYFERYKDEYIDHMFRVSTEGAWSKWIGFCLRGVIEQAREAVHVCDALITLKKGMHEKAMGGNGRIHGIVDDLFSHPYIRISDLGAKMGVTYHTARADVHFLIKKGILTELPKVSPKTYVCPGIFEIAYGKGM